MVSMSTIGQLDCALPPKMAMKLRECSKELQMMPEAASQALALIQQPDCSIAQFAQIVEKDVKLAASILSLSNSPFYSPGRPIGNVREAVVQVGFRQCQNLIQASCATSLMQRLSDGEARSRKAVLNHSLTTAMVSVELSKVLGLTLHGVEFTAGLMHDIGRLLLSVLLPEEYKQLENCDFIEQNWSDEAERATFGTDHTVLGCMFAVNNSLPDPICEAIRFHHSPERAQMSPALTALTAAADDIANFIARQDGTAYSADDNAALSFLLQLDEVTTNLSPGELCDTVLNTVLGTATAT